jgi:hypothetical protein
METATLELVSFYAGGFRFAMEARLVRGMARVDVAGEGEAPAADGLLGLAPAGGERRILCIGVARRRLAVCAPVELSTLPASRIFALPSPVAARLRLRGVRALAWLADGPVFIVDADALLDA